MSNKAFLTLENGMIFQGEYFGAQGQAIGEIVFTTGMTGYLETITDPSYYGQIVLQTFPLIGNYGVIPSDFENASISISAYIAKHPCNHPSNFRSEDCLENLLNQHGIIGIRGIDTRALTKVIRENGVMNGKITCHPPTEQDCANAKEYFIHNAVAAVSSSSVSKIGDGLRRVALLDFGAKRSIADALVKRDCQVWTFPYNTKSDEIMRISPDGIILSNGPGNPADPSLNIVVDNIAALQRTGIPIFGICLGHQLLARANGYITQKMKFGHRGANQPVKDRQNGRVYITSQNHGYTVVADDGWFMNVNDRTCEGLDYGNSFSVQFHPEACGGPMDTAFLFDRFIERMNAYAPK